jgi:hypothetical protein
MGGFLLRGWRMKDEILYPQRLLHPDVYGPWMATN